MVARGRFFREDFDRRRDFIATRDFIGNGKKYVHGQVLDKTKFSVRRLRQLYDQRFIEYSTTSVEDWQRPPVALVVNNGQQPGPANAFAEPPDPPQPPAFQPTADAGPLLPLTQPRRGVVKRRGIRRGA